MCGNTPQRSFNRQVGAVKHVQACLSASKGGESSLHYCGGPVKLVQACLCRRNSLQPRFYRTQGAISHVQVCLCASTDQEAVFTTVEVL